MATQETDSQRRARQTAEHVAKYDALAKTLGEEMLGAIVLPLLPRCAEALKAGDEHLNTIPLATWDRLAGLDSDALGPKCCGKYCYTPYCPNCGKQMRKPDSSKGRDDWPYAGLRETARGLPWSRKPGLSLSERVCVLKHVASKLAKGL